MKEAVGSRQSAVGMAAAPPVTAHAVIRYLTRIEGFDLRPIVARLGRDAGNRAVAQAAADAFGAPYEALQRAICPPHLEAAVRGGAARVRREGLVLMCEGGLVVSVVETERRGFRARTRKEFRTMAQKLARRAR